MVMRHRVQVVRLHGSIRSPGRSIPYSGSLLAPSFRHFHDDIPFSRPFDDICGIEISKTVKFWYCSVHAIFFCNANAIASFFCLRSLLSSPDRQFRTNAAFTLLVLRAACCSLHSYWGSQHGSDSTWLTSQVCFKLSSYVASRFQISLRDAVTKYTAARRKFSRAERTSPTLNIARNWCGLRSPPHIARRPTAHVADIACINALHVHDASHARRCHARHEVWMLRQHRRQHQAGARLYNRFTCRHHRRHQSRLPCRCRYWAARRRSCAGSLLQPLDTLPGASKNAPNAASRASCAFQRVHGRAFAPARTLSRWLAASGRHPARNAARGAGRTTAHRW